MDQTSTKMTARTMTTPVQKSDIYGQFFWEKKRKRLLNMMWNLVFSQTNDPLYVQVYNSQLNTVESLSLTFILNELIFNNVVPFPDKTANHCNQVQLYSFYFVSSKIYHMIQENWNQILVEMQNIKVDTENDEKYKPYSYIDTEFKNGKYIGEWNMDTAYQVQNTDTV